MQSFVEAYLEKSKKKIISLLDMQQNLPGNSRYLEFTQCILDFEARDILLPIKKHGNNGKVPLLYNSYRINRSKLSEDYIKLIHNIQLNMSAMIQLDAYLKLSKEQWEKDYPYIQQLDDYIKQKGLPKAEATLAERSYEVLGNEKWLSEEGGKALLERLGLLKAFKITTQPDPLMLAVNPKAFTSFTRHLIVENKATFYMFLKELPHTTFTSLIYGCGWKITAGIDGLYEQLGIDKSSSTLYYFGDLDYEGLAIVHALGGKIKLAVPFYEALLKKEYSYGKERQRKDQEALAAFLNVFSESEKTLIQALLDKGAYYPQEALGKEEAYEIWRMLR